MAKNQEESQATVFIWQALSARSSKSPQVELEAWAWDSRRRPSKVRKVALFIAVEISAADTERILFLKIHCHYLLTMGLTLKVCLTFTNCWNRQGKRKRGEANKKMSNEQLQAARKWCYREQQANGVALFWGRNEDKTAWTQYREKDFKIM